MKEIVSPGSVRWDVREPFSRIARRLAVDEETVRRRLARLRESGVIGKYVLFPNPHLLDRESALLYLESKDSASMAQATSKLKLMDGIVSLLSLHAGGLLLDIYYQSDASLTRQVTLIESICGTKSVMFWKMPYPQFDDDISKTDWIIVGALRKDPRKKLSDLALDLGISARTLNRRIKRLTDGNALLLDLEFNISKVGGLPFLLLVYCEDKRRKREVDEIILSGPQSLVYSDTSSSNHSLFAFACENISEVDNISGWTKKINGVNDVKSGIIENRTYVQDWIDEEIQTRIAGF